MDTFREHLRNDRPLLVVVRVNWDMFKPGSRPRLESGVLPVTAFDDWSGVNHAVIVVGYNDRRQLLKILNSAGAEWGDGGYAYVNPRHFCGAIESRRIYALGGPKEAETRVKLDISVGIDRKSGRWKSRRGGNSSTTCRQARSWRYLRRL
jgi:hypothetical protein